MNRPLAFLKTLCGACLGLGILVRVIHLGLPNKVVFDEIYFPVMANDLLHGKLDFDAHPPLGKLLIAGGIKALGYDSVGNRIVVLLFGLALIALFYFLGRRYFSGEKEKTEGLVAGLLLATFIALDCMLIVYSRLGLMDGIMLFFIFLTFFHALKVKGTAGVVSLGLLIGCCVSIKWLALGIVAPVAYVLWRRKRLDTLMAVLPIATVVYIFFVSAGTLIAGNHDLGGYFGWWHKAVWDYQTTLKATHPWSSLWYTWPFMARPLLMMRDTNPDGTLSVINAIGNPLLWYSSTVAVAVSVAALIRERFALRRPIADHPTVPLLIGWAAFLLPWIPVTRVLFIYHYLPSYGFALMLLAYWLVKVWRRWPWAIMAFLIVTLALTVFFLPVLVGWPISQAALQWRVWFPGWI